MIVGIVLAAGESLRMGSPKALLKIGNQTFLHHIVETVSNSAIDRTIVVLGAQAREIQDELGDINAQMVVNERFSEGQLSSILKGLETAERDSPEGIIIHPVDHPAVNAEVIRSLISAFRETRSPIVLPVYRGRRGHPVFLSAEVFDTLKRASPNVGARSVIWNHADDVYEVETDDEGVVRNIDTPEDYEHLQKDFQRAP